MSARKAANLESTARESVLLVEDDGNDVLLTTFALQKLRPTLPLKIVSDGEAAIAYLKGTGIYADRIEYPLPSLILLDIHMPRKSGFEVLEWIRRQRVWKHLPVVVFSSSSVPSDVHQAYHRGANSYLVKPGGFDTWVELLNSTVLDWMKDHNIPEPLPERAAQRGGRFHSTDEL
jgi:CheY-like chemotaxis protein